MIDAANVDRAQNCATWRPCDRDVVLELSGGCPWYLKESHRVNCPDVVLASIAKFPAKCGAPETPRSVFLKREGFTLWPPKILFPTVARLNCEPIDHAAPPVLD